MTSPRATCPNCGAEIVFRWSGAVQTTCPSCKSILVRKDLDLTRVGMVADVPPAMSRIQLGTEGTFKKRRFVVVGRIMYAYDRGHWNEWHIRFADDTSGWLSDAQGEYAITRQVVTNRLFDLDALHAGESVTLDGTGYTVAAMTRAHYAGTQGELPFEYWDKADVAFVDLNGQGDRFATIDFSDNPALVFAGEYEPFDALSFTNLTDAEAGDARQVRTQGANCPQCGAALELRLGALAKTIACSSCGSVLDATNPTLAIVEAHRKAGGATALHLPLGSVGQLHGASWTVVGFQLRGIVVEGETYSWEEYLLWNIDRGFRYLTQYNGHWNDVTVVKGTPKAISGSRRAVEYNGAVFKHFQGAIATTRMVLGEFPWEARTNDTADDQDYIAPPLMLSRENTVDEITWSLGTYTAPATIQKAFGLRDPLPAPHGVFANQPNPRTGQSAPLIKAFFAFAAVLLLLLIVRMVTAGNQVAFSQSAYRFQRSSHDTGAFVTPVFTVGGHTSNVELRISTDLTNSWAFFNVALLADTGGTGFEFGREVSYYAGSDEDGPWTEGSRQDAAVIPAVPPGRYYLRIEPDVDPALPLPARLNYGIEVRRDVPRLWPFGVALLLLAVPVLIPVVAERAFERARWQESDYATPSVTDALSSSMDDD